MIVNCTLCNVNTAGQHETTCPLWRGYVSIITFVPTFQQPTEEDCKPGLEYNFPVHEDGWRG